MPARMGVPMAAGRVEARRTAGWGGKDNGKGKNGGKDARRNRGGKGDQAAEDLE